jgi:outer membrane lipoprotein SlyB
MRKALMILAMTVAALPAIEIPVGQQVRVRLGQTIASKNARSGDNWDGTLASDLKSGEAVLAKRGTPVHGKVVEARSSGRLSSPGYLKLQLTSVNGSPVRSRSVVRQGASHKGRNIKSTVGGAGLGAAIGAIAGGGKGAAIGAGAGAAAGTVGAAATGKKDVTFPVETVLTFTIR